jgi:hypothetical protein
VNVRDGLSMHMATPVIIDLDMTKVRDVLEHARAALSDEDCACLASLDQS